MAQLKSLLVNGTSRFLNTIYATDLNVSGTTSFAGVTTTGLTVNGAATVTGTLTLTKTTDLSGTANNSPALIIGGAATAAHIEIDANEIQGKATGTTTEEIFINNDGGKVNLSNSGKIYANNGTFRTQTLEVNGSTYYFNSSGNINANGITASTSTLGNATITTGVATDLYVSNELRSAKHTIETISHLGGVFYVAPSIELPSGNNVSITAISGNTISATINDSSITTTAFSPTWWAANSIIKIAGSIAGIPIGTCSGTIQAALTTGKLQINFTYPNQTKKALATGNNQASNGLSITLTTIGGTKPIGIYISALGDSTWVDQTALNKTAISIYGGTTDGAVPDNTNPVVRIGNLAGLPQVNGKSPVGWGIYTNHGYFDGVIVSNEGKIGGWTLGSNVIYSGTHNTWSHASNGLFLGTTRIAGGNGGTWYLDQAGTGKIGRWTFASNGEFSTTVSSNTAGMGNGTYAFWAGAASGSAASAPFRIKYDGSAVFTNAIIGDPNGYHIAIDSDDVGVYTDASTKVATFGADGSRIGSEAEGEYNLEITANAINYKVGEIPIIKNIVTFTADSSVLGYSYYQNMMATSNGRAYVMYGSAPDADNDNPTGTKTANATLGVNGGTDHEAWVYCGSDAYNGNPAVITSINGLARLILTEQNAYLYNPSNNTMTTVDQNGNIQSAGQAVPFVLPWTFSNQTAAASTRGTLQNLSVSSLPSSATVLGVVVTNTPNRHWIWAYAYYANSNNTIGINYVNEYNGAISGSFSVLIFYTL